MSKENLLNKKFSKLLVIEEIDNISNRTAWRCRCDCGNIKDIKSESLKSGDTKSCGCLNIQKRKERSYKLYSSLRKLSPTESTAKRIWKCHYNEISFNEFLVLSQQNCYYCDSIPNNKQNSANHDKKSSKFAKDNGEFIYNGLDRLDNSKSHTIDNLVPCCKWCNYSKRERSVDDFKFWIIKLYENFIK